MAIQMENKVAKTPDQITQGCNSFLAEILSALVT